MAKEDVVRLFRDAQVDPSLREKLNQAPNPENFVEMARELGYNFTVEEWKQTTGFQVEEMKAELSEIPGI